MRFVSSKGVHGLGYRLLRAILLINSVLALVVTGAQIASEYRKDVAVIQQTLRDIAAAFEAGIVNSVWAFDDTQSVAEMRGILRIPDIVLVETELVNGQTLSVGKAPDVGERTFTHTIDLHYTDEAATPLGTLRVTASLSRIYRRLTGQFLLVLLMNLVKTLIVSAFIIVAFEHLVTRHLRTFAAFARNLNLDRLDVPLVFARSRRSAPPDELDDVEHAINVMQRSLREGKQRHQELEERLQVQLATLHEADKQKDQVMAMLAHELRNPLAPIRSGIELIRDEPSHYNLPPWLLSSLDRQSLHLQRIVDHLMLAVQTTYGKLVIKQERLDLTQAIRDAVDECRARISAKQLKLHVTTDDHLFVMGDPTWIQQVIVNLLDNAVKFTPTEGAVSVAAEATAEQVVLRVKDSGVGIGAAELPHIFEPFVQAEQPLARTAGGLGLGLAIVKKIMILHGGSIEARSDEPGKGAEFILKFQEARHAADRAPPGDGTSHENTARRRQ